MRTLGWAFVVVLLLGLWACPARAADAADPLVAKKVEMLKLLLSGKIDEGLAAGHEVCAMCEKKFGARDPQTLKMVLAFGTVELGFNRFDAARADLQKAYDGYLATSGASATTTLDAEIALGQACIKCGAASQGEALLEQALAATPADMIDLRFKCLSALLEHYVKPVNAPAARLIFNEMEPLCETRLAGQPVKLVQMRWTLAKAALFFGDYNGCDRLLTRAWQVAEQLPPDQALLVAELANTSFDFHNLMNDIDDADRYLIRAQTAEKSMPPDSDVAIETLDHVADLEYGKAGSDESVDYKSHLERALAILQREHEMYARRFGATSDQAVYAILRVADLQMDLERYDQARVTIETARHVIDAWPATKPRLLLDFDLARYHLSTGQPRQAFEEYKRAADLLQASLGARNPKAALLEMAQSVALVQSGDRRRAGELVNASLQALQTQLIDVFSYTSEQQRLDYLDGASRLAYTGYVMLEDAPALATSVLHFKGLVLDSLLEDTRNAADQHAPEVAEVTRKLQRLREQREQQQRAHDAAGEKATATAINDLERLLARHVQADHPSRAAFDVTVGQVASRLPRDGVLVEFLRYTTYPDKAIKKKGYAAVVIAPDGHCSFKDLGAVNDIDRLVGLYRRAMRTHTASGGDQNTANVLARLYEKIWAPLELTFPPHTAQVVLSPDDQLNFVSFATLQMPDQRFLCEKYRLYYVTSGRDLLKDATARPSSLALLFGAPDYERANSAAVATTHRDAATARAMRDMNLPPLPGTATECKLVSDVLRPHGEVQLYLHEQASESQLRDSLAAAPVGILHLATHGFFVPSESGASGGLTDVPHLSMRAMDRSGLALAGAQTTISELRSGGEVPPSERDGLLTAAEVSSLPLQNTWLVVLSACDTGSGEAATGEGVFGLRRGFVQAGAQHLLMTLWPVADAETSQFMGDFYRGVIKTNDPSAALADTQRQWLVRLRQTAGLTEAVQIAGPFIMSSQGNLAAVRASLAPP